MKHSPSPTATLVLPNWNGPAIKYLEEAHEERPVRKTELQSIWRGTQPPVKVEFEGDKEKELVGKEGNWIPSEGNLRNFSERVRIQNSFIHSTGNAALNKPEKKKSLHSENLHSSGHNVKHYDLEHKICLLECWDGKSLNFRRAERSRWTSVAFTWQ